MTSHLTISEMAEELSKQVAELTQELSGVVAEYNEFRKQHEKEVASLTARAEAAEAKLAGGEAIAPSMTERSIYVEWPAWATPPALHYNRMFRQWYCFHGLSFADENLDKYGQFIGSASASAHAEELEEAQRLCLDKLQLRREELLASANALPHPSERTPARGLARINQQTDDLLRLLDLE